MTTAKIAIVGAGPGGLVAALCAAKLGFETVVYDQVEKIAGPGGSWVLNPNGLRVLKALDLADAIAPIIAPASRIAVASATGTTLLEAQYSCASVACKDLLEVLLASAIASGVRVEFNQRLVHTTRQGSSVRLQLAGGSQTEANIVIGGDGIHSRVRQADTGFHARVEPLRRSYLRGVVPVPAGREYSCDIWSRDGRRFGIDPLPGNRCGFYASIERHGWSELKSGSLDNWKASWSDFGDDVMRVMNALSSWEDVTYDEPCNIENSSWSRPNTYLVGDAAHAQAPNAGQGANSAMVDSYIMMRLLHEHGDTGSA